MTIEIIKMLIRYLIENPKEECNLSDLIIIWQGQTEEGYTIIKSAFEKINVKNNILSSESILCHLNINISESIEDTDNIKDSRFFTFDIYKDEMILLENIISQEVTFDIFKEISNITSKKYTFHKESIPILTIDKDNVYYWSKK